MNRLDKNEDALKEREREGGGGGKINKNFLFLTFNSVRTKIYPSAYLVPPCSVRQKKKKVTSFKKNNLIFYYFSFL